MDKEVVVCIYIYIYIKIYIHTYIYTHTHTYIHTMEYYSPIKKNEIMPFAATWMDLESVIQSEVSQKVSIQIPYANTYIWNKNKYISEEPRGRTGIKMQT